MTWFRPRPRDEAASGELRAAIADLLATVNALRRDLDDLDESFRRFRSRRAKQDAIDGVVEPQPQTTNGHRKPTLAEVRASGSYPFHGR